MLKRVLEALVLPPMSPLLVAAVGLLLRRWRRRLGTALAILGLLLLWCCCTPVIAGTLLRALETDPALPATGSLPSAQAIVVLSAEADVNGAEYGGPTVGALTLQRLRYAAALHKRSGLPILTSGGVPATGVPPVADLMAATLQQEFEAAVRWRECRSADTWENAAYSAELLARDGVRTVLLVTHSWHMPRAVVAFAAHGIVAVPAPTLFRGPAWEGGHSLLPTWQALRESALALHEWLGLLYYRSKS